MHSTITIDIGTTSVKLCAFDADGGMLLWERGPTPTLRDAVGEIYDVASLSAFIIDFIRRMDADEREGIRRVSITGVGESGGLVAPDITLVSPMILWHDHRGAGHLESLTEDERAEIYRVTGLPVNANYGLSKAAWAAQAAGDAARGAQWLNVAEFLAATMTGRRWSEYSLASRTMALDVRSKRWSEEVCAILGLDVLMFPELHAATTGFPMTPDFARVTGLSDDVRVHVAGHDHMVGAVGAALERGQLLNSTGTTEGLLFVQDAPSLDQGFAETKLANGVSCSTTDFTLFASIPTGGSAFATLQSLIDIDASQLTDRLTDLHRRYLAGAIGLDRVPLVLPRFRGSPPPDKDAEARGVVAGIRADTSADDLIMGCFLGMALQFRDVLSLFPESPTEIKVIGPAARNPLWLQVKADLLNSALSVSQADEVVSRGAQAVASQATVDWRTCLPRLVLPDAERADRLAGWSARTGERWAYLKGMPV